MLNSESYYYYQDLQERSGIDMSVTTLSNLLIAVGILWCIAGYFTYMQTVKANMITHELGPLAERLYCGKNAGFMRTRRIVFAAATNSGTIVDARVLHAAVIFKPAKVCPFNELKGKNIFRLDPASMNLEPVMEKAVQNLIRDAKLRRS